jgi:CBS domain-containing membrane protein
MTVNSSIPISELMTTDLIIVRPHDTMAQVAEAFRKNDIHHLPVVNQEGELKGILSKSDFLRISHGWTMFRNNQKAEFDEALYQTLLVKDVMTKDVAKLAPSDALSVAAGIFRENLFHCIPVIDKGVLVGMITTYDLLKYAFEEETS